jgi:CHAT domain-containing protein/tetratricopeptide (TPR) repeat protein
MKKLLLLAFIFSSHYLLAQSASNQLLSKIEAASAQEDHELVLKLCAALKTLKPPDSIWIAGLFYQSIHSEKIKNYDLANRSYLSLLPKTAALYGKASINYITDLTNYTMMLYESGQQEKVVAWYEKELSSAKKNKQYLEYCYLSYNYGTYYEAIGAMTYAIRYYKEGLIYIKKSGATNSPIHLLVLHYLARALEIQHRYDQAESLYKEALQIAKNTLEEVDEDRYLLVNDFGMLYFFTHQYNKALPYFKSIKTLIDAQKIPVEPNTTLLANLADCYAHLGRYEDAEKLYIQVEKIERTVLGVSSLNYPVTISRMGDLYAFQERYEKAKTAHLYAIDLAKEHFLPQDLYLFYNMEQAYLFFDKIKDWKQVQTIALDCFQRNCMDEIPTSSLLKNIQTLAKKQTFATMPYALKALKIASKSYWEQYKIDKNETQLLKAYDLQLATRTLLHRLKNSFSTEWDKLELLAATQEISELGILISQELFEKTGDLNYQNSAFEFLENNKYILLQDALQSKEAMAFGKVPQAVIQKEEALDQALLIAKTKKIAALDAESKQKAIENYNQALFQIDQFKENLQTQYPTYYQNKYTIENTSIQSVQKQLNPSTLLIEYFIGKKQVYVYTISSKEVYYKVIPISNNKVKIQVEAFRKVLSNYNYILKNPTISLQEYQELAYWFYQKLLAPALEPIQGKEHLIIIPDGFLGHLPFEAFLTTPPDQTKQLNQLDFFVEDYKISYAYASNLLLNKSISKKHHSNLLAMGATYSGTITPEEAQYRSLELSNLRKELIPLDAISTELEALKPTMKGKYYYGKAANEKTFKEEANQYAILHLAMHGILNKKHPILSSLAFTENGDPDEDNFLQAFEISQMKLNAELVVLSACETGYGKFKQGEGVMSLARSFMYAGVPSMVVSMWQVNDASTSIIMSVFYNNLAQGMDKAEALQKAKLSYIDKARDITMHPAFWAPFIQLGDSSPIQLQQQGSKWFWLLGIVGVLAVSFAFWRFGKQKKLP